MAKRFTDTSIWGEDWFLDMPNEYKLFWYYMLSNCDHSGIYKVNMRSFCSLNEVKLSSSKILEYFNNGKLRIRVIQDNVWFIEDFFVYQYGETFNTNNRVHESIKKMYEKYNINLTSIRGLKDHKDRVIDKDKDIDKVKDKDKEKIKENKKNKEYEINFHFVGFDIVELWDKWKDYKFNHFKFKYKTAQSEQAAIDNLVDLSGKNIEIAKDIVNQSIANGWKGFFLPQNNQNKTSSHKSNDNPYQRQIDAAIESYNLNSAK
jgi:hypothetical protein